MSVLVLLGLGVFGGVGAISRFLVDSAVQSRLGRRFPVGTLAVNVTGAFLLGLFVGLALDDDAYRLLGTGLAGAYTRFSTWALESHRHGEDGELRAGAANFAVSLVLGVLVAWVGRSVGGCAVNVECLKLTTYFGERARARHGFLADRIMDVYAAHELNTSLVMRGTEGFGAKHGFRTDRVLTCPRTSHSSPSR